ncbi:MAG: sortase B protein-sorting domain-containing protein [Acutalibacteraceae bacterium]
MWYADPHDNQGQVTPSQLDNTEEQDNSSDNPQTGDDSNLVLPIIILSASGIGLVGVSHFI